MIDYATTDDLEENEKNIKLRQEIAHYRCSEALKVPESTIAWMLPFTTGVMQATCFSLRKNYLSGD